MLAPISTAHLFPEISAHLVALLRSLSAEQWHLPTVSSRRDVKDIAAHLLDGTLRRLSMQRDGYRPDDGRSMPRPDEPLTDFLNRLNDQWETATRRLSPRVLVDLIETTDRELATFFASLEPHGPAIFPVAWAGEELSEHWFDVARDYTEKWHHTAQIFDAVGLPRTIDAPRLLRPCLETFMRALPYTYREISAPEETVVSVVITGAAGGRWNLVREAGTWRLEVIEGHASLAERRATSGTFDSAVTLDPDTAWRLFTKRRTIEAARRQFPQIEIAGDRQLGEQVLGMVSVMA